MDTNFEGREITLNALQKKKRFSLIIHNMQVPYRRIPEVLELNDVVCTPRWVVDGFPPPFAQESYIEQFNINI